MLLASFPLKINVFFPSMLCHICAEPQWWVPHGLIKVQNAHRTSCGFHQPCMFTYVDLIGFFLNFFFFLLCTLTATEIMSARNRDSPVPSAVLIKPSENLPHTVNAQRYHSGTRLGMMVVRWILTKLHQRQVSRDCCKENITWVSSAVTD